MKTQKLTKQEIDHMFKTAPRIFKHVVFDVLAADCPVASARLAVVTPKHIGNAVHRNKIRRRLKALFTKHHVSRKGKDLIIIAKKQSVSVGFDRIEQLFERMLEFLERLKTPSVLEKAE